MRFFLYSIAVVLAIGGCAGHGPISAFGTGVGHKGEAVNKLAPSVSSSMAMVETMLALADITREDVIYDLGSGDGRIVIAAAKKYGARGVGFEIDPKLIEESRRNVLKAGVKDLVEIRQQNILEVDLSAASVVTLYLFPEANRMLRPRLWSQLKPGARVVSNYFDMDEWVPDKVVEILDAKSGFYHKIYLWRITDRPKRLSKNRDDS